MVESTPLTIEDVDGGLARILDERWVLHELCEMLLRGVIPDRTWLANTYERTAGRIPVDIEGGREVLPLGERRADYIAAWNTMCAELGEESARRLAYEVGGSP